MEQLKNSSANMGQKISEQDFDNRSMNINETTPSREDNFEEDFEFYIEGVTLTFVASFGIVGNFLSLVVLFSSTFRYSFSNLLRGLAFCDLAFLVVALFSFGLPQLSDSYKKEVFVRITPYIFGALHTFRVGSVFVTVGVTLERFVVVNFPLRSHGIIKKYLLPAILIFSVLFNVPKFFEIQVVWDQEENDYVIKSTELRKHPLYIAVYVVWSKLLLIELLPYFSILILNAIIIGKTWRASKFRGIIKAKEFLLFHKFGC